MLWKKLARFVSVCLTYSGLKVSIESIGTMNYFCDYKYIDVEIIFVASPE